jgi:hypothetical protein
MEGRCLKTDDEGGRQKETLCSLVGGVEEQKRDSSVVSREGWNKV